MFSNLFILGSITPIKIFRPLLRTTTTRVKLSVWGPSILLKKLHPSALPDALALTNVLQDCKSFVGKMYRWGATNLVGSDYHQHSTTELLSELLKSVTLSDGK
jgi:hypothetical protein